MIALALMGVPLFMSIQDLHATPLPQAMLKALLAPLAGFFSGQGDQEAFFKGLLGIATDLLGAESSAAYLVLSDGSIACRVRIGEQSLSGRTAGRRIIETVLQLGKRLWIPDITRDSLAQGTGPLTTAKAVLALPLVATGTSDRSRVIGALYFELAAPDLDDKALAFGEWLSDFASNWLVQDSRLRRRSKQYEELLEQVKHLEIVLRLDQVSRQDTLTHPVSGLVTWSFFETHYPAIFATAKRYDYPLTVLALQVDPPYERATRCDTTDRQELTAAIGAILKGQCRTCDTVSHSNGGHFLLLLPHTSGQGAVVLSERIQLAIGQLPATEGKLPVTASIGLVEMAPDHQPEQLLAAAVAALNDAQEQGTNKLVTLTRP